MCWVISFIFLNFLFKVSFEYIGALFDPRYKLGWIHSSGLSESAVLEAIKIEIKTRYQDYLSTYIFLYIQSEVNNKFISSFLLNRIAIIHARWHGSRWN